MSDDSGDFLERILDPVVRALPPEAARRLIELRADEEAQARMEELADKCSAATLTDEERSEYKARIDAATMIAILQARAKDMLARTPAA